MSASRSVAIAVHLPVIRYPQAPPFGSRLFIGLLPSAEKGTALHEPIRKNSHLEGKIPHYRD